MSSIKFRFIPDEPILFRLEDRLGLYDFVQLIYVALQHTQTPFVYGVLGDWGSGKTSILRILQEQINTEYRSNPSFIPIWFNAWEYENESNLIYPLLYTIKKDYEQRLGGFDKAKNFGKSFLKFVATTSLALTDVGLSAVSKSIIGDAVKIDDIAKQLKEFETRSADYDIALSAWADKVTELRQAFHSLINSYADEISAASKIPGGNPVEKENVRFVILVDDLDRCLPETTIAILEGIKNFLAVEQCVFILGLNPKVVYQGVRMKYKGLEVDGREYLEKIVNYSFYVPEPSLDDVSKFAIGSLDRLFVDDLSKAKFCGALDTFGNTLKQCKFSNPRKIKRILNHYLFFLQAHETDLDQYNLVNIIRFIIMAEYYPSIFQLFLTDADQVKSDFVDIGKSDYKKSEIESKYGFIFHESYSQLSQMKGLFDLTLTADADKPNLTKHALAVFRITHLPS